MGKTIRCILAFLILACPGLFSQDRTDIESALLDAVTGMNARGKDSGALGQLRALAAKAPENDAVFYYLAKAEALEGDFKSAVSHLEEASRLDPGNDEYKETLARFYSGTGQSSKADDIYLELLKTKPEKYRNAYTMTILGDRQLTERKDSLAMESYDLALLYDPDYIPAVLGKAELNRMKGNFAAYFVLMDKFAADREIQPKAKCSYIRNVLKHVDGHTYSLWNAQLDSLVSHCVEAHPTDSSALKLGGWWFLGTGKDKKGEEYYRRFVDNYSETLDARWLKLEMLIGKGDIYGVLKESEDILKIKNLPKDKKLQALNILGDYYYMVKKSGKAFSTYGKALKIDGSYVPVLNNYAYFLSQEGRQLKKALEMSATTIEKHPDNPTYLDTYGWILHLMGRDAEAKPYFKHSILYGGKQSKEILFHYSEVLSALGEKDLASYYKSLSEQMK